MHFHADAQNEGLHPNACHTLRKGSMNTVLFAAALKENISHTVGKEVGKG